jgi:DNA excision repair protein ERCC-6
VNRELHTVGAAVQGFQSAQVQGDEEDGQQAEQLGGSDAPSSAVAAGGTLQQAVMQQRLGDLQARKLQLEEGLAALGISAAGDAASVGLHIPKLPAGNPPGSLLPSSAAAAAPAAGRQPSRGAGSKQRGKKKQVQFDLAEADVFADVEAAAGAAGSGGGGGEHTGLVETERDRLIRLGILTPFDRLGGFERKVQQGLREAAPASDGAAGSQEGQQQHDSIRRVGEAVRAAKAARPTSILMDHTELPRPERMSRWVQVAWQAGRGMIIR